MGARVRWGRRGWIVATVAFGMVLAAIVGAVTWPARHAPRPAQALSGPAHITSRSATASSRGRSLSDVRHVVALGDSVTSGSTCNCTSFPDLIGERLTDRLHRTVAVDNDGEDGQTTNNLLDALDSDAQERSDVASADLVVVTIGANDLSTLAERTPDSDNPCPASCYTPPARQAAAAVGAVAAKIRAIAPSATVVVTNYWDVFQDGRAVDGTTRAYDTAVTTAFDGALGGVAAEAGLPLVDLVPAFKGGNGTADPTALLLPDGDHPSAAGHERIAAAVLARLEAV